MSITIADIADFIIIAVRNKMDIKKTLIIGKPIAQVWEVLGNQFGEISKWSSLIKESKVYGDSKLADLDYSIRETNTKNGITKQEMISFDPKKYSLSYKSISGTPAIIKEVRAHWRLTKKDANSTGLFLDFSSDMKGIGYLLEPFAKIRLGKVADELLDELRYYLENGKPHPRKLELK
jgi:uncharacterized membrane protein